jgi:hypothetical protein
MKMLLYKHHLIGRLLVLCDTERHRESYELNLLHWNTSEVRKEYDRQLPKLKQRGRALERIVKRQERIYAAVEAMKKHDAACAAWSERWVHPEVQYPMFTQDPNAPRRLMYHKGEVVPLPVEKLQFGLAELYETALLLWLHKGDDEAMGTCRMIGVNPTRHKTPRGLLVPREVVETFRMAVEDNQAVVV